MTSPFSATFVPAVGQSPIEVWPGASRRTVVWGPRTMLAEIRMKAGTVVDPHQHPHVEEVAYVAAGRVQISVKGRPFILQAGDAFMVPPGIEHANTVLEDAIIIDCFSPPREEWKP
jgi:quercetin dioxygenase-like cupin family protein